MRALWFFLFLSTHLFAETLKSPVVDDAGLFTPEQEATLVTQLDSLRASKNYWLVVHTLNTLSGEPIEDYAVKKFKAWEIGEKGKDNGLLLVIAVKDRKMRLEVGYGLEGDITDIQAVNLLDAHIRPAMRSGDPAGGVLNLISALNPQAAGPEVSSVPTFIRSFFLEGISEDQMNGYRYTHDSLYNQKIHLQISQTKEHFYKEPGLRAIRILVAPDEFSIESEVSALNLMDRKDIEEAYRAKGKEGLYDPVYRIGNRIVMEENLRIENLKAERNIRENGMNRWVYYSYMFLFPLYLAGGMVFLHRKTYKEIFSDCEKKAKQTIPGKAARIRRGFAVLLPVVCLTVGAVALHEFLGDFPLTDLPVSELDSNQFFMIFFMLFGSIFFFVIGTMVFGLAGLIIFFLIVVIRAFLANKADRALWWKELPDAPSGGSGGGSGGSRSSSSSSSSSRSSSSSYSGGGRSGGGGGSSSW